MTTDQEARAMEVSASPMERAAKLVYDWVKIEHITLREFRQLVLLIADGECRCEFCGGTRGGVPGNENLFNDKLICDYCHADKLKGK